jgi:hypothetical protein
VDVSLSWRVGEEKFIVELPPEARESPSCRSAAVLKGALNGR